MWKKISYSLLFLLGFCPQLLLACDCDDFIEDSEADYIFEGKALATALVGDLKKTTFQIYAVSKGKKTARIDIYTPASEDDCGIAFEKGKEYIVYALLNNSNGYLGTKNTYYTTYCTMTMSFEEWDALYSEKW